jgi:hypothetical protein
MGEENQTLMTVEDVKRPFSFPKQIAGRGFELIMLLG